MLRTGATDRVIVVLALAAIAVGACSSLTDLGPLSIEADTIEARMGSGVVFIGMKVSPTESMSALFEGAVVADEEGCLRLDSVDRHTVVWPHGYGFDAAGGTVRILDAQGGLVGRVGEDFDLGGGEVTSLHDGLGFTQADRDLAEEHCPGRYWIVGTDD